MSIENPTRQEAYAAAIEQYDHRCFSKKGTPCKILQWCAASIVEQAFDESSTDPDLDDIRDAAHADAVIQARTCYGMTPDGKCQL